MMKLPQRLMVKRSISYAGAGLLMALVVAACTDENEHFCARYQYVYDQLLEPGNPSYGEMKQQLQENLSNPKKESQQARFMLFVLADWRSELVPAHESSGDFCQRIKRWQSYP